MENRTVSYIGDFPAKLSLMAQKGCKTRFLFANLGEGKDLVADLEIEEGAEAEIAFADLSEGPSKVVVNAKLENPASSFHYHGAVLAKGPYKKEYIINATHLNGHNEAYVENYGIAEAGATLLFYGAGDIRKGAKKAKTKQSAKIIVFDKDCKVSASPTLLIDENDVEAGHASVEGRLNDEHMFYLRSRGLSEKEARTLITYGYLKPIAAYFPEEEGSKILEAIEGGI